MREELIQVRIVADNFDAALRFYRALKEDGCVSGVPEEGYARIWSTAERPGAEVEIFNRAMATKVYPGPSLAPLTLVYLTDDVDALVTRLRDVGAEVIAEPQDEDEGPDPTRLARVRSPAGEVIEVKTPGVAHSGFLLE